MIDDFLKDFLPYATRRKLYSGAALLSLVFAGVSGAEVVTDKVEAYPLAGLILSVLVTSVSLLARANATAETQLVLPVELDEQEVEVVESHAANEEDLMAARKQDLH